MPLSQLLRRPTALVLGALLLGAPALASCGFDYATNRVNTPATGVNDKSANVDVLAAVVVAARPDSGTFIASFANNSDTDSASVTALAGAGAGDITAGSFQPIEMPPLGFVNLAQEGGVPVTGSFTAGDFVSVEVGFADGESSTLQIPVVTDCNEYAGLDETASDEPAAGDSSLPVDLTSVSPSPSASPSASPTPSTEPSAAPSGSTFPCAYPSVDSSPSGE